VNITNNQEVRNLTSPVAVGRALNFCHLHYVNRLIIFIITRYLVATCDAVVSVICKYFIMSSKSITSKKSGEY